LNGLNQASAITTATGGTLFTGINSSTIVSTITSGITGSFANYTSVGLDLSGVPAGVNASYGGPITGVFDRSITRTFNFSLTFTGATPGTYDFNTFGTVNGGQIATETDHIVVTSGGSSVPDGASSLLLLGMGLAGVGLIRRKLVK